MTCNRIDLLLAQYRRLKAADYYGVHVPDEQVRRLPIAPLDCALPIPVRRARILNELVVQMPVFIKPGELIVGHLMEHGLNHAAYPAHLSPAEIEALRAHMVPVNHIIADYPKLLRLGLRGIQEQAATRAQGEDDRDKREFLDAVQVACQAGITLGRRYAAQARALAAGETDPERRAELAAIADVCERVPEQPAQTLQEALQSLWFAVLLQYTENTALAQEAYSPGRLDQYLQPFYQADLEADRTSPEQAQELIACLFIKYAEIATLGGELVTLGGVTARGTDATNDVSFMCLRATARLKLHAPKLMVRLTAETPEAFLHECIEMVSLGLGSPAFYNDRIALQALVGRGVPAAESRDYALLGCWEMDVEGREYGSYMNVELNLAKCLELALNNGKELLPSGWGERLGECPATGEAGELRTFDNVLAAYKRQVEHAFAQCAQQREEWEQRAVSTPSPFLSALIEDCVEKATDISAGGARYNFTGSMALGVANVADSLAVIRRLVYETSEMSLPELVEVLRANYDGHEALRARLMKTCPRYGNDDDEADALAVEIVHHYCDVVNARPNWRGGWHNAGLYNWEGPWPWRIGAALPDGTLARQPLAQHLSATCGAAQRGPTVEARSVAKLDFTRARDGAAFIQRLHPSCFAGEGGANVLALIRSFFALGGLHIQFNVVDSETLKAAQDRPEAYEDLVVRVAGWSARFVELSRDIQDAVIAQTEHRL